MNKVFSKILILLVGGSLIFSGCTSSSEATNTEEIPNQSEVNVEDNSVSNIQRTQARPGMFGKVKSIIGNEVILELAEMPQKEKGNGGEKARGEGKPASAANGAGNGNGGQRSMGVGAGRELKLTGETATILIPVGVSITSRSGGELKELDIADIYEGSTLQIWFDEEKNITQVMMM